MPSAMQHNTLTYKRVCSVCEGTGLLVNYLLPIFGSGGVIFVKYSTITHFSVEGF